MLVEAFNAFLEGKVFDLLAKYIPNIFGNCFNYSFGKKYTKTKHSPFLSHKSRNFTKGKEEIFSSISLLLAHLGIKGGDRETTLELGIHKAWSFHPFHPLGRNFKELGASIFVHLLHHTSFVSMIPPCFKFIIYSFCCISCAYTFLGTNNRNQQWYHGALFKHEIH